MESKKVAAVICGGIGNQLYIISALLTFAKNNNYIPICDGRFIENLHTKDTVFELYPKIFDYIKKDKLDDYVEYIENESIYEQIKPISSQMLIRGYFQHYLYFDHQYVKEILSDWLNEPPHNNIVLHVRRGDYIKSPEVFNSIIPDYYYRALEYFPEGNIIVISEDLEWCQLNINNWNSKLNRKFKYQNSSIMDDLKTIANAKNGIIIANSTFSWWGAFLNMNNPKVVFPQQWFSPSFIYQKDKQYYVNGWTPLSIDTFNINIQNDLRWKSKHSEGYEYSKKHEKYLRLNEKDQLDYNNNMLIFTWYLSKMDECREYSLKIFELWKGGNVYANKTIRQNIRFPMKELDIKINLTKIPCIIISLPSNINKRNNIKGVLIKYGMTPIFSDGVTNLPTRVMNIGQAHINAIKLGISLNNIFLIFEEDFVFTDEFKVKFTLPPMTDGFFLGHSRAGLNDYCINQNYNGHNNIIYEEDIMEYYRIKNTLALHGVLYCNRNYCNKVLLSLELLKKINVPCDIATAFIQEHTNILTCNNPWCYQESTIDKPMMEQLTNLILSEL